ncbi:HNH endonuclease signature motif containing protein [Nocardioides caldifontis]|uniref:HNH endonuclease signature motif containing protein n=1 Tax=Nocardioides caldifontis TaxID=2588938 RepID=UPI0011DF7CCF|nr:HNH endonuclease signature motif containing protein [Nocardioides caldifontis]
MTKTPPLLAALRAAHAALDEAVVRDERGRRSGWVTAEGMLPEQLSETLRLQASLEGRVGGLRLHVVAAADRSGAPEDTAATDTAAWAAAAGRNRARSWGGVWLANLLEEKYLQTRAALVDGRISEEHAAIIVRAAESATESVAELVPGGIPVEELERCEKELIGKAEQLCPRRLRRAARRILEPLSKRLADQHEGDQLIEQERRAERRTWLQVSDNGDGTWTVRGELPEAQALMLKQACERLSAPRRKSTDAAGNVVIDPTVPTHGGMSFAERMGLAFCELIEHVPTTGHHVGRSEFLLPVNIDADKLREGYGAGTLDTGVTLSHEQVRRLACEARHIPLVWGGKSVPLDLGTSQRLFTWQQAAALGAIHDSCPAKGCERPFAWCELHHRQPWPEGGPTDLENAAPLCGHHHRRVHDSRYEHEWLPDGSIRCRHRWPSRWRGGVDPWADHPAAHRGAA